MAKKKSKKGKVSLRSIVTALAQAQVKATAAKRTATLSRSKRLDLKIKKLKKVEQSVRAICDGLYI